MEMYKDASFVKVLEEPVSSTLIIPKCFARETGIANKSSITLKNEEDGVGSWEDPPSEVWIGRTLGNTLTFSIDAEDDPGTLHVSREPFHPTKPSSKASCKS